MADTEKKDLTHDFRHLVFSCSGAADTGALADQAARKLMRDGKLRMFCITGVGGKVESILKRTREAETILAIDGCIQNCVKHSLEQAGFTNYKHLPLVELGYKKGHSPMNANDVARIAHEGEKLAKGGEK